ncbi:hypothetical protein WBK31_14750 [Nonomuraea sp. N2-4H]|uniref:hypothetical protein n=1 Tax=Nonomuraea sp. N2-4H TaxID=3128898 RepID=UPI0032467024
MLLADVQHDYARTLVTPLASLDAAAADAVYREMEAAAAEQLEAEGFGPDRRVLTRTLDVRYQGQEHSVTVSCPDDPETFGAAVASAFAELHERQYGHTMDDPVEVTTLRLRATGTVDKPELPTMPERASGEPRPAGTRRVYLSEDEPAAEYRVYIREDLLAGDLITGPAVITEHTATSVIHAGDSLRVGRYGELVISVNDRTGRQ